MRKLFAAVAVALAFVVTVGVSKPTVVHADAADEIDDGWYCMQATYLYPWNGVWYFYDNRWDPDEGQEYYYYTGVRCY